MRKEFVDIVFVVKPSAEFVRIEDPEGNPVALGYEWTNQRADGRWALRLTPSAFADDSPVQFLTLQQRATFDLLICGKTNAQIAGEMNLSEKTVKAHVTAVFKTTGCQNRAQLIARHYLGEI